MRNGKIIGNGSTGTGQEPSTMDGSSREEGNSFLGWSVPTGSRYAFCGKPRQRVHTARRTAAAEACERSGAAATAERRGPRGWQRIAPELHRLNLLTVADLRPPACYCAAYGERCQAEDGMTGIVADDPHHFCLLISGANGNLIANPLVKIRASARDEVMRYAAEFGFTPASRTRISGTAAAGEPERKFSGLLAHQT
jgi:P27 family predicted phage terminase small subunit